MVGSDVALFWVTVLTFRTVWAWPSLLNFAVVQRSQRAPGIASGDIVVGQYRGGLFGPLVFGAVVERSSYRVAWAGAGGLVAVAAVIVLIGGRALERAVAPIG